MESIPNELFYVIFDKCEPCSRLMLYYVNKNINSLVMNKWCITILNEFKFISGYTIDDFHNVPIIARYIFQATMNGDLDVLKHIHSMYEISSKYSTLLICIAAMNDHKHIIEWSIENKYHKSYQNVVEYAVGGGNVELTKWLINDIGYGYNNSNLQLAIGMCGSIEMIEYCINELSIKLNNRMYIRVAKHGHLEVLKWLEQNDYKYDIDTILDTVAQNEHYNIIQHFYYKGHNIRVKRLSYYIASNGDLDMLKWIYNINPHDIHKKCIEIAASHKHYHIVDWIIENIQYNRSNLLYGLINSGSNIDKIKYYIENGNCEWSNSMYDILCEIDNDKFIIDLLEYVTINMNITPPEDICDMFVNIPNVFKWCVSKGYDYNSETISNIVYNEDLDTIIWLDSRRQESCKLACEHANKLEQHMRCSCTSEYKNSVKLDSRLRESCKLACKHANTLYNNKYDLYDIYDNVVYTGSKKMLKWLFTTEYVKDTICIDLYTKHGNTMLKFLHEHGYDITTLIAVIIDNHDTFTVDYFVSIAHELNSSIYTKLCVGESFLYNGKFRIEFISELCDVGCKMDKNLITNIITNLPNKYNKTYIKTLLLITKDNGCKFTENICLLAMQNKHYSLVRFLIRNGCKWDSRTYKAADSDMKSWLKTKKKYNYIR